MGNYLSPGSSGQKRKQSETDSTEHDFNTDLTSTSDTNGSASSNTSQINENLEESSSRLTGILNRLNQTDTGARNRGGLDPTRNLRSSDFDSLLFNRSRIARAT
jgi:hypothetical protein